jgi:glycosyltransferase involved in cell wall biosynthesis
LVHPSFTVWEGAEKLFYQLAVDLSLKNDVTIYTIRLSRNLFPAKENVRIVEVGGPISTWSLTYWAVLPRAVQKLSSKITDDVVMLQNFPANVVPFFSRLQKKHIPWFWYCEEPFRAFYDPYSYQRVNSKTKLLFRTVATMYSGLDKWGVSLIDLVTANSKYIAGLVKSIYGRDAKIIYNGVDTSTYKPSSPYAQIASSLKGDEKAVLAMGSLSPRKNNVAVVKTFKLISNKMEARLFIVGKGPERQKLEELARSLNIRDKVVFLGFVPEKFIPQVYSSVDLLVYLPIAEPFGLVPLEAMACGLPVVANNQGGNPEIVVDGETGFLVESDLGKTADACIKILMDPELTEKMGEEGKRRVHELFEWKSMVQEMEKNAARIAK